MLGLKIKLHHYNYGEQTEGTHHRQAMVQLRPRLQGNGQGNGQI